MQQRTYRGKDLDAVMKRIADEHGDNTRIVAVDKSRYGGLLGFFQREEHVLVTEVDKAPPISSAPTSSTTLPREIDVAIERVAQSIEELLANQAADTEDVFEVAFAPPPAEDLR